MAGNERDPVVVTGPVDPDKYYTPEEAAAIIRVHLATIYRWMKTGVLPNRGGPRIRRVQGADILRLMDNQPETQE